MIWVLLQVRFSFKSRSNSQLFNSSATKVCSLEKWKYLELTLFERAVRSQQPSLFFFPQGPYLLHDVGLGYQRVFIAYWKNSICNLLSPLSARPLFLLCCFLITSWQVEWSRIHVGNLILQKDNYERTMLFQLLTSVANYY